MIEGLSVIVPSFGRPERLRDCLEALLADPDPFEVVVVDDGSPEPLEPLCAAFGPRVRCLRQPNRGPAAARNAGVRAATGGVLAFTDSDCQPRIGWAGRLRAAVVERPRALVGGRVENALSDNVYAAASQSLCDYLYEYYGAARGEAVFFTSNNLGCRREEFEAIGGFDESFPLAAAEDRDFGLRWRAAGGELIYEPEAVIEHAHALDLTRFWRQHRNYGRGARRLHAVMAARGDARPRREPLGFYLGLVTHPLQRRGHGRDRAARAALMALSQMAMISGYVSEGGGASPPLPAEPSRV